MKQSPPPSQKIFTSPPTDMAEIRHTEIELKLFGKTIPILSINDEKKGPSSEAETEEANGSKSIKGGEIIPCPRCSSRDTKFCYFNNYNVKQPRHFCRNCQRYWTAGGSIRNVPVGAGRRKTKSSNPSLSIPTHNFAFQFYPVPGFWSLGKRSREENCLWAPKTLRFDDSEKLRKCSWWEALGFQDEKFDFASS